MRPSHAIHLLATLAVLGCSETPTTSVLPDSAEPTSQDALDTAFTESEAIRFLSWNGVWIGTDCDTEIELRGDGSVVLTEYGYGVDQYDGTYTVTANSDGESEISLTLKEYQGSWPSMAVYTDQSELLLIPTEGEAGFVFGNRAGATVPSDAGSYWPFRQIPLEPDVE